MPKIVISPKQAWSYEFGEIYKNRQLLYFFTWRNFIVKYKQAALGVAWSILKPLISMVIYVAVFSRLAGDRVSGDVPYPVFMFTGLLFWQYFSQSAASVGNSLISYQGIIKKIYFPRLIVPISTAISGLVDFCFSLVLYVVLLVVFNVSPPIEGWLMLPVLVALSFMSLLGLGLVAASLNVKYRDVQQILPFILQLGFFLTPVVYSRDLLSENLQWLLFINPMAGIIELARSVFLGSGAPKISHIAVSGLSILALMSLGMFLFRKTERSIGDII